VHELRKAGTGRPDAGVKLAEEIFRLRRWQESPVTGESAKETVKTIAQGRPGYPGEPVVAYSYAFSFCMRVARMRAR